MNQQLLTEIFRFTEAPNAAELTRVVVEFKNQQQDYLSIKSQGYYDRMQRACSWLAKAKEIPPNPEGEFIFTWIALNALTGIRQEVLKEDWWQNELTLHPEFRNPENIKTLGELEWFLWRVAGLDERGRLLKDAIRNRLRDIIFIIQTSYLMPDFWNWKRHTEKDIKQRAILSEKIVRGFINNHSNINSELLYRVLSEIVRWRLRTLRNQLFHGCATDTHSKRRDAGESEIEAGTRILNDLVWAFIRLMTTKSGQSIYWPPIPYPRADSPQHQRFNAEWLS